MNLKMEDLFVTCEKCNGEGNITETTPKSGFPGVSGMKTFGPCKACKGIGGSLTETGNTLVQFLRLIQQKHLT